jgi:hypothetical protein
MEIDQVFIDLICKKQRENCCEEYKIEKRVF